MKKFLFCIFFGFIFKSNAQEINSDYFNNFRRVSDINDNGSISNIKNFENIQTNSLSGRYFFTDKFSLGIGLNYRLNKKIVGFDFDADLYDDYYIYNTDKNVELYFSPTFKLPIKKIKGLGQYSPELFFSYCIGIGALSNEGYRVFYYFAPNDYGSFYLPEFQEITIPSFFQLQASVPLKNIYTLNISLRGAQRNLNQLDYDDFDLFQIRPVQVGFGIGYKFNSFKSRNTNKSRNTKGTREVI